LVCLTIGIEFLRGIGLASDGLGAEPELFDPVRAERIGFAEPVALKPVVPVGGEIGRPFRAPARKRRIQQAKGWPFVCQC
jgi:hypothetical protein